MAKGWWLLGLLSVCGCSSDGDDKSPSYAISSATLSGKIGGESWSFVAGETDSFLSDSDQLWADLYAEAIPTACQQGGAGGQKNHLILSVPTKTGDFPLSLSQNATFVIEGASSDNLVATQGRLVVDTLTDTAVTGKAHIIYDADNEIDGTFQLTKCP